MTYFIPNLLATFGEIILLLTSLVALPIAVFAKKYAYRVTSSMVITGMLLASYALIKYVPFGAKEFFNGFYISNALIILAKLILLFSAVFIMMMQINQHNKNNASAKLFEFPIILIIAIFGMMVMISANDFITFYLGLELQSLCLYILVALDRDCRKSNESATKYFILGALSSGILLFGISFIYGFSGTTNFTLLTELTTNKSLFLSNNFIGLSTGIILLLVGLFFKISVVPFHMWTPDVYQGSPTIVTTILASTAKFATIFLLCRILMDVLVNVSMIWQQIIVVVAIASLFVGSIGALKQTNIKRLLAYSYIGHIGFMLVGIASATQEGYQAMVVYSIIYLIMSLGMFSFLMLANYDGKKIEDISLFKGLAKRDKLSALFFTIIILSMTGLPPLAGFYAKFFILKVAMDAQLYYLVICALISSVISAFYYLRLIKFIYFDEPEQKYNIDLNQTGLLFLILSLFNLLYFIKPFFLMDIIKLAFSIS